MHYGMKRLNKRQVKKLVNKFSMDNKRHYRMYKVGFHLLCSVSSMQHHGKDKKLIIQKAEEAVRYGLKLEPMTFDEFIKKYQSEENPYYKTSYLEGSDIEDAFSDLASEAGYMCDRFCLYRFVRFYNLLELCKYHLNMETSKEMKFEKQEDVINKVVKIFNEHVEHVGGTKEFSNYYNNKVKELKEDNGEDYEVYDDSFYPTPYSVVKHIRYILNYVNNLLEDEDKLRKHSLYNVAHALRQAERVLGRKLLPENVQIV